MPRQKRKYKQVTSDELDVYFKRKFDFANNENWTLPQEAFKTQEISICTLQNKKAQLNQVKSQLNDFNLNEWHRHTKFRDPSTFVIETLKQNFQLELLTQAWCKFYECLCSQVVIPEQSRLNGSLNSLHLCEAPGAFICALNHYLVTNFPNIKWKWLATTLNPNHEGNGLDQMIPDDRFYNRTRNQWTFGLDETGDITKYYNHLSLVQRAKTIGSIQLVTADGSINCMSDPGDQERQVHFLHYCEALTALAILEPGGTFVAKMFTMFETSTVCLVYLLNCSFTRVHVFKPCTSKSGNSEVYVICLQYKGFRHVSNIWHHLIAPLKNNETHLNRVMFNPNDLNSNFLEQIEQCNDIFMKSQMAAINQNVYYFGRNSIEESFYRNKLKQELARHFTTLYGIVSIPENLRIVNNTDPQFQTGYFYRLFNLKKKWTYRKPSKTFNTPNLYRVENCERNNILNIVIGKKIHNIQYSKFAPEAVFYFNKIRKNKDLYNTALACLLKKNVVINMTDLHSTELNSHFHHEIFYVLKNAIRHCDKNLIIIGIPLVTNFLVGLFFIVSLGFEHVHFFRNGFFVFSTPNVVRLTIVERYFNVINNVYESLSNSCFRFPFEVDILQIISQDVLYNCRFVNTIWNYNVYFCK